MKKLLFGVLFLTCSCLAFADTYVGRVVKLRGEVSAINAKGGKVTLKEGDKINVGYKVISQSRSFVKILMLDDTVFQLGPKSEFIFEKFKMKNKNDRTATYNLVRGKLRSLFTKKAPKKTLIIKTPSASMGIRGTEIVSDVYTQDGEVRTDIALLSGKLEIQMKGREHFFLGKGEIAQFSKGSTRSLKVSQKKMHKDVFKQLNRGPKSGGSTFLFDARKKVHKSPKKGVSFQGKKRAGLEKVSSIKRKDSAPQSQKSFEYKVKRKMKNKIKSKSGREQKRVQRTVRRQRKIAIERKRELGESLKEGTLPTRTSLGSETEANGSPH